MIVTRPRTDLLGGSIIATGTSTQASQPLPVNAIEASSSDGLNMPNQAGTLTKPPGLVIAAPGACDSRPSRSRILVARAWLRRGGVPRQ